MALPVIFGLTCPHPTDLQANAHTQVVIIYSWIFEPQAHRLPLIVYVTLAQQQLYPAGPKPSAFWGNSKWFNLSLLLFEVI